LGGALYTPFELKCRENWDYSDVTTYDQDLNWEADIVSDNGSPDYRIAMPLAVRAGAALTAGPVLVSGDVEMLRYNQIEYKTDPSSMALNQATANLAIQRHMQNVTNIRAGGEFSPPGFPMTLRAGYAIIRTPYKDVSYEKDRIVISFGMGFEFSEQLVLDAGYASTKWEGPQDNLISKQNLDARQILVSVSYRM
jgi:long-subunit fatty acid transport protein